MVVWQSRAGPGNWVPLQNPGGSISQGSRTGERAHPSSPGELARGLRLAGNPGDWVLGPPRKIFNSPPVFSLTPYRPLSTRHVLRGLTLAWVLTCLPQCTSAGSGSPPLSRAIGDSQSLEEHVKRLGSAFEAVQTWPRWAPSHCLQLRPRGLVPTQTRGRAVRSLSLR